jgi:hypothetical protein
MVNYYPQKSADELLVMLDALQKRATTGFVSQTSAAGLQQIRSFQNGASVAVEIKRVLYSLWKKDSETYANPYASRIRRTRPNYTGPTTQTASDE